MFYPQFVSMKIAAIFDFRALTKARMTLKRYFKCSEKLHTHRRHIYEETYYTSVFSFVEYYIFNQFLCKKTSKKLTTFQIFLGKIFITF